MDLDFNPFEAVAVAIAVTVANLITLDGRSDWLEGTLLLATYVVLGRLSLSSSLIAYGFYGDFYKTSIIENRV